MKQCTKCHEWKDKSAFNRNARYKTSGLNPVCKMCDSIIRKAQYAANPEHYRKRMRKYYADHPDAYQKGQARKKIVKAWRKPESRVKSAEYKRNHREQARKWQKTYYQKFKDKCRAAIKKWYASHPNFESEYRRKRYAENPQREIARVHKHQALLKNAGTFTQAEWDALCARYGNRCLRCGSDGPLTIDHVIPLSRGGKNTIDNIQPLCHKCNSSKGAKHIDYR